MLFTATFDECTRLKKFISEGRDEVYEAFLQEYEMQKCMGYVSEEIDGYLR